MTDTTATKPPEPTPPSSSILLHPLLNAALAVVIVAAGWMVAQNWNRWTGAARFQATTDAYVSGDVTPLSARVSGNVLRVAIVDNQDIRTGDLIAEIDPSDYLAQRDLALANRAVAQSALDQIGDRRAIQGTIIQQAEATIRAAEAERDLADTEASRQRSLLQGQLAGTRQLAEQADAAAERAEATLALNEAELAQQKLVLSQLDIEERGLAAQLAATDAQAKLAQNDLDHTRILSPIDGMVGQRQVRPGQFVNVGSQIVTAVPLPRLWVTANLKETQMTDVRVGNPVEVAVDAFPDLKLRGRVDGWPPGTGSTFALLPPDNATGNFTKVVQRIAVKIALDPDPALGSLVRPGLSVVATIDTGLAATSPSKLPE